MFYLGGTPPDGRRRSLFERVAVALLLVLICDWAQIRVLVLLLILGALLVYWLS